MLDAQETWDEIESALEQYGLVDDRNYEATAQIFEYLINKGVVEELYPDEGEDPHE